MSIVGPRPLLVRYLDRYNEEQHHRHDVRPGLTGYAQAHGRNTISWEDKFAMDVWYTKHVTFSGDIKIIWDTLMTVIKREGITYYKCVFILRSIPMFVPQDLDFIWMLIELLLITILIGNYS